MTDYEREIIDMIRNSKDPKKSLEKAIDIVCSFLAEEETKKSENKNK